MLYMLLVWFLLHSGMEEEEAIEEANYIATWFYYGFMLMGLILLISGVIQMLFSGR